ncbi:MAG: ABC transporter ATP-binding protein [Clostridia bacterium]|nr:ABC transporter ATP-binding protein [Clostridia bacterium]
MASRKVKLLLELMKGIRLQYAGAMLAIVVTVAIGFISPLMLSGTIDALEAAANGNMDAVIDLPAPLGSWFMEQGGIAYLLNHLWIIAIILVLCHASNGLFQFFRARWTAKASETIAEKIRNKLYSHLQVLPYDYHVKAQTGDLIQRCTSDVETMRRFLSSQVVEIFRAVLMVVVALVILIRMNPRMTLYSMILVPPLFVFAMLFFNWVRKYFTISDEAEGKMSAILQENLTGVRVVRAFGRQKFEEDKFYEANDDLHDKSLTLTKLLSVYWSGSDALSMIQTGITLVAGIITVATYPGELSVGEMTVFVSYISMLLWPIRQLGRILSDMGKCMVSFERIDQILREKPEEDAPDAGIHPIDQDIEFRHVGFEYEKTNPVLKDINFTVKQGQTVAILGATGSGKSTLMHLLQRLYDVKRGAILIGGVDIRKIQKPHLRSRVGLVLQEPFLYSRSVRNNIGIVKPNISDEEIYEAARTASAHDFITGFDNGYETMVGERGVTLSGGQKQRVAIARTLLKDNDILIFDDSLSAVDTETDRAIRAALNEQRGSGQKKTTTFIISHRLTTLAEADVIIVIQDGKVAQQGTHEELIQQEGLYKRIYQIQTSLEEELNSDREEA